MRHAVPAIAGEPLPYGLLGSSCARVEDVPAERVHELMGIDWLALGCCPVLDWADPCVSEESPGGAPAEKEFCRPAVEHADPITVYAGTECSAPGWSWSEARAHARASLELGEQQAVEEAWQRQLAAPGYATDLTPAEGPVSVAQGVAALEGCLGESYGGRGVLHVPTGVAALLGCCGILRDNGGGGLATWAGNCVVIGAGYSRGNLGPGLVPAEPGSAWLYITGPVVIRRGPVLMVPDEHRQAVNTRTNDMRVLAERTYVVGTTCTPCAIRVTTC